MEGSLAQSGPGALQPWSSLLASPALALGILLTCISCHLHPTPFFGPYCAACGIIIPCRDQTQARGSENSGSPDHSSAREVPQTPCSSYLSVRLAPMGVRQTPPPGSAAPFNQPSPLDLSPSQALLAGLKKAALMPTGPGPHSWRCAQLSPHPSTSFPSQGLEAPQKGSKHFQDR